MIIAITGHRPEKIPDPDWTQDAIYETLEALAPEKLIQGMAAGVDLWSAYAADFLDIPFVAARPWAGHTPRRIDRVAYGLAMKNAVEVVNVNPSEKYPGPWVYQERNEWMVDHADEVLAVWDGVEKGGTWNCVNYARDQKRTISLIDPITKKISCA